MFPLKLICFIILLSGLQISIAQQFNQCLVYQFTGTDSSKKHLALAKTYNSRGQLISEEYTGYRRNAVEGNADGIWQYYYQDTILVKRLFVNKDYKSGDTLLTYLYYDSHNLLIREEEFECERRLMAGVDKGYGRPGGCIVLESDLDKNRTWKQTGQMIYTYNDDGNIIMSSDQYFIHTWGYDSVKRVSRELSYEGVKLFWVKDYTYFPNGYAYTTIHYGSDGKPEKPDYSNNVFSPVYTVTCYLNSNGKIIKEETTTEKGLNMGTELTLYNDAGQVTKTEYHDKKGKPEITHIYEYK
jgi:hypothetical protein